MDAIKKQYLAFTIVGGLTLLYCLIELVYASIYNSVTILSDGFHNFSDVASVLVAFYALRAQQKDKSETMTYGWARAEVLGGLINGSFLIAIVLCVTLEAIPMFINPGMYKDGDNGLAYIIIASIGLFINTFGTVLFALSGSHGHSHGGGGGHDHSHGHSHGKDKKKKEKKKEKHNEFHDQLSHHTHDPDLDHELNAAPSTPLLDDHDHDHHHDHHDDHDHDHEHNHEHDHDHDHEGHHDHDESAHGHSHGKKKDKKKDDHDHHDHDESAHGHSHGKKEKKKHDHDHDHDHQGHGHSHGHDDHDHDHDHDHDDNGPRFKWSLNMYALIIHYFGDMVSSFIVLIAGILLYFFPDDAWAEYIDPSASIIIMMLITWTTIPLLIRCSRILMQRVPSDIDIAQLNEELLQISGVKGIHELHVWPLVDDTVIASVHIACLDHHDFKEIAVRFKKIFHSHGIHSTSIQPEFVSENTARIAEFCQENCVENCDENWCCKPSADQLRKRPVSNPELHL
eukprot:TRINITY_DN6094_c0_g1_i1.p1 TRINITY_DN6094_c0_g1~~TRINITY_DN6094_c0_g1_i1.p1  ORF type:complete len:510 (-),score=112.31 TRINITY_DN6094_c0_g1_i1:35-1564(-)